jgi:hypothetical protein
LLGLYECFQIFGGEIGKGSLPLPLKKDEKSMNGGKNGSGGASAYITPMEACR